MGLTRKILLLIRIIVFISISRLWGIIKGIRIIALIRGSKDKIIITVNMTLLVVMTIKRCCRLWLRLIKSTKIIHIKIMITLLNKILYLRNMRLISIHHNKVNTQENPHAEVQEIIRMRRGLLIKYQTSMTSILMTVLRVENHSRKRVTMIVEHHKSHQQKIIKPQRIRITQQNIITIKIQEVILWVRSLIVNIRRT